MSSGRDDTRSKAVSSYIEDIVSEVAREFHDEAPASSRTQAYNLWDASGLTEGEYGNLLYVARARTRERGNIKKEATSGGVWGTRNKMPYFWVVMQSLIQDAKVNRTSSTSSRDGQQISAESTGSSVVRMSPAHAVQAFEGRVEVDGEGMLRIDQPLSIPL